MEGDPWVFGSKAGDRVFGLYHSEYWEGVSMRPAEMALSMAEGEWIIVG